MIISVFSIMKITIITVGKLKEKYLKDAVAEYSKRLSKYCKLEIIEVADEKTPDTASEVVENQIRQKEGERILKYVKEDAYVITLEIGGAMLDSVEFSKKIQQLGVQGKSHIIFIIGGSIGLGTEVLKRCTKLLCTLSSNCYTTNKHTRSRGAAAIRVITRSLLRFNVRSIITIQR